MSRYSDNIFTVYDMMEKKGLFRLNPANRDSQDPQSRENLYKGPVQFPKMLYSPTGEYSVIVPAEIISTPFGPQRVGEQRELVSRVVTTKQEEAVLKKLGWLDHPAKSIDAGLTDADRAAGKAAPAISSDVRVNDLEAQLEALKAELAQAKSMAKPTGEQTEADKAEAALGALGQEPEEEESDEEAA